MSEPVKQKTMQVAKDVQANIARAYKAGVKISYGSDLFARHGENAGEAVYMHQIGMDEMDIIVAATVSNAEMFGLSDSLGTIEVGKHADIIATDGSPLENISELLDVDFVMKGGKVYK